MFEKFGEFDSVEEINRAAAAQKAAYSAEAVKKRDRRRCAVCRDIKGQLLNLHGYPAGDKPADETSVKDRPAEYDLNAREEVAEIGSLQQNVPVLNIGYSVKEVHSDSAAQRSKQERENHADIVPTALFIPRYREGAGGEYPCEGTQNIA